MRKIRPYILVVTLFVYLIIVLTFVSARLGEVPCKGLQVAVKDTATNSFIDDMEVLKIVKRGYGDIVNTPVMHIDKDSVERLLARNSVIKSAQVYYSLDGYFHVEITHGSLYLGFCRVGDITLMRTGKLCRCLVNILPG